MIGAKTLNDANSKKSLVELLDLPKSVQSMTVENSDIIEVVEKSNMPSYVYNDYGQGHKHQTVSN